LTMEYPHVHGSTLCNDSHFSLQRSLFSRFAFLGAHLHVVMGDDDVDES